MIKNERCCEFIKKLPKAELHVHIEGTMEPSQLHLIAERNKIAIPPHTLDQAGTSYLFTDINSFVTAYMQATQVLCKEQDFYDIMHAYLKKVAQQGVLHTEIFFDLQTYMPRGIAPEIIINGMHRALVDGKKQFGISGALIMCFMRHLGVGDAFKALELLRGYNDKVIGVGLASVEKSNSLLLFQPVLAKARAYGFHIVAHAGEQGAGDEAAIGEAITKLHLERIDHGIDCMRDVHLVKELAQLRMPLTVCPLSNVVLGYVKKLEDHPLKAMFDAGLNISINSDDPAFFGGYIGDNYCAAATVLGFSCSELVAVAHAAFEASFLGQAGKDACLAVLSDYVADHSCK